MDMDQYDTYPATAGGGGRGGGGGGAGGAGGAGGGSPESEFRSRGGASAHAATPAKGGWEMPDGLVKLSDNFIDYFIVNSKIFISGSDTKIQHQLRVEKIIRPGYLLFCSIFLLWIVFLIIDNIIVSVKDSIYDVIIKTIFLILYLIPMIPLFIILYNNEWPRPMKALIILFWPLFFGYAHFDLRQK